jgi:DNA repair protein SbcC/Rad50
MRPRELTIRGFRSYRDEVTFDFRDRHLVGVVGPIGAGKSTILDAIAFALFGRTPRVQRETRSLINQLADAAHVQLTFEVDGAVWRITRVLKRKGQGQVQLVRLATDDPDAEHEETVLLDRQVRERVERLLGMDFETFGRSVLLAQNRFAEFLLASDAPRNAVLKGVFGYERFDAALAATRDRVARAETAVTMLDADGARLVQARAELDAARAERDEAVTRRDAVAALKPTIDELDAEARNATDRAQRADAEISLVRKVAANTPDDTTVAEVLLVASLAEQDVAAATEAAVAAAAERQGADAARDAAAERIGDLRAFADLVAQLDVQAADVRKTAAAFAKAADTAKDADQIVTRTATALEASARAVSDATAALAEAADARTAADEALHAAQHAEMATTLRRTLVAGEPCPVCAQTVQTKPRTGAAAGIKQAERARTAAATRHDKAAKALERANATAAKAAAQATAALADRDRAAGGLEEAERAARTAEATLATTQSALVDQLGEGDPAALLDERQAELREADAAARASADRERAARDGLDVARRTATEATARAAAIRERLAAAWGALGEEALDEDLEKAAAHIRHTLEDRTESATEERTAAARASDDARQRRTAALDAAGLDADTDLAAILTQAEIRAAETTERVSGIERTLEAGADLNERMEAARTDLSLATRLRDDLQPSQFLAWLLGEERAALAELASVHLEALTDGDFRFTDDETFHIVDVNAGGTVRAPDSLSGGETFLASLALALALAEMVTRGGSRLDSFFLDEGFGSLDPEHIELAMRGVEHLVTGADRLVILVSHVEQMHALIEDLIVLDKDDAAAASRVVSGARLGTSDGRGTT